MVSALPKAFPFLFLELTSPPPPSPSLYAIPCG